MRTAHCEGEDLAHDDCPAPLACSCPRHLSDGNRAREQATLAKLEPIRGAQFPPKAAPVVDQLPPARATGRSFVPSNEEAKRVFTQVTAPPADGFDAGGVFSQGLTDLVDPVDAPKETTMPRGGRQPAADCPDCGEHFTSGQGLGSHKRYKKCPGVRVAVPSTPPPSREPAVNGGATSTSEQPNVTTWELVGPGGDRLGQISIELELGIFDLPRPDRDHVFAVVDLIQATTG